MPSAPAGGRAERAGRARQRSAPGAERRARPQSVAQREGGAVRDAGSRTRDLSTFQNRRHGLDQGGQPIAIELRINSDQCVVDGGGRHQYEAAAARLAHQVHRKSAPCPAAAWSAPPRPAHRGIPVLGHVERDAAPLAGSLSSARMRPAAEAEDGRAREHPLDQSVFFRAPSSRKKGSPRQRRHSG